METKKIIIEIDGKRHRMVRGKVSGDMCSKCSLANGLCTKVMDPPCLNSLDYFVKEKEQKEIQNEKKENKFESEYSHFETIYKCGRKPRWKVGDTLACYIFRTDCEYEEVLGKVTKVEFNKKDWYYTFENSSEYDEESLLEDGAYKK